MDGLRGVLLQLSPSARDHRRTVLIREDRDEIAQLLLRYGDASGDGWADLIDTLTMYPDVRRQAVRLLAEIDATASWAWIWTYLKTSLRPGLAKTRS